MIYTEAPNEGNFQKKSLFLAGGITGCPDWQSQVVTGLKDTDLELFNPRRENFPIHNPDAALEQISWEYRYLRNAHAILFWFPSETLCPIVLYELGAWSKTDKPLFVGIDLKYQRRHDVEIQTKLARPDVTIVYSLEDLIEKVKCS